MGSELDPAGRSSGECQNSKLEPGLPHRPEVIFAEEGRQNILDLMVMSLVYHCAYLDTGRVARHLHSCLSTTVSDEPVYSSVSGMNFCQLCGETWHLKILVICITLIRKGVEHRFP